MCGIIFIDRADQKSASKMVLKRYNSQKTRGKEGFGFISIDTAKGIGKWFRSTDEAGIKKALEGINDPTILFHHRQPTSTPNFAEATHPIAVINELLDHNYYVIHNGIISNDKELREKHRALNFEYTTEITKIFKTKENEYTSEMFNDSEAFAIELAQVLDGQKTTIDAKGSIAFIALQVSRSTGKILNVYFGRNYSNPLKMENTREFLSLTSEGTGTLVDANKLYKYNPLSREVTSAPLQIGESYYSYDKEKFIPQASYSNSGVYDNDDERPYGFRSIAEPSEASEDDVLTTEDEYADLVEHIAQLEDELELYQKHYSENPETIDQIIEMKYELDDLKKEALDLEQIIQEEAAMEADDTEESSNKTYNLELRKALEGSKKN